MRLAIVLPSLIQTPERARLADLCFQTLSKTDIEGLGKPYLILLTRPSPINYDYKKAVKETRFNWCIQTQPEGMDGTEEPLAMGADIAWRSGFDYIMWIGEDALFHPMWMSKLGGLVDRHPEAKAWSVYRSAHEEFHKTLREERGDVLVRSMCAHGMTFTMQEWREWWPRPDASLNTTLDLMHPIERPGERWCTDVSYIEHTGREGVHTHPEAPEWAVKFQGIGE